MRLASRRIKLRPMRAMRRECFCFLQRHIINWRRMPIALRLRRFYSAAGVEHIEPFLNRGADGISALMARAKELGITLTEDTAAKLISTGESVDELSAKIRGSGIKAMTEWSDTIAVLSTALDALIDKVKGAINILVGFGRTAGRFIRDEFDVSMAIQHDQFMRGPPANPPTSFTATSAEAESKRALEAALAQPSTQSASGSKQNLPSAGRVFGEAKESAEALKQLRAEAARAREETAAILAVRAHNALRSKKRPKLPSCRRAFRTQRSSATRRSRLRRR